MRDYRDYYGKWVTGISLLRATTSLASVGGWLTVSHLSWLWATLLITAQLSEQLQSTFPFSKKQLALSRWCRKLNVLVVFAQGTWDEIESGKMTGAEIRKVLRSMRMQQNNALAKAIPNGLPIKTKLIRRSREEAEQFFIQKYSAIIEK